MHKFSVLLKGINKPQVMYKDNLQFIIEHNGVNDIKQFSILNESRRDDYEYDTQVANGIDDGEAAAESDFRSNTNKLKFPGPYGTAYQHWYRRAYDKKMQELNNETLNESFGTFTKAVAGILVAALVNLGVYSRENKKPTKWVPEEQFVEQYRKNEASHNWLGWTDTPEYKEYEASYELYDEDYVRNLYHELFDPLKADKTEEANVANLDDAVEINEDADCSTATTSTSIASTPVILTKKNKKYQNEV